MRILLLVLAGCTGTAPSGGGGSTDGPIAHDAPMPIDAPPVGTFAVSSPSLTPGGTFAAANTCDGANDLPALAWTCVPDSAGSYALVLTDTTISLTHAVIYDIPISADGLPAALAKVYAPPAPAGTHEASSIDNTPGYSGPCPPQGQAAHVYEFAVYALDVATLPGATMASTRAQLTPLITQHMISKATLTGNYAR